MVTVRGTATAAGIAGSVPDPELPMLTVADLGILRSVREEEGQVTVVITPTYSGCPAVREIAAGVRRALLAAGYGPVEVRTELSPPWTTDWITAEGRRKLAAAGIAPPRQSPAAGRAGRGGPVPVPLTLPGRGPAAGRGPAVDRGQPVACPRCGSGRTERTAEFGSTACKALYRCGACGEPFEHVKEI